MSATTQEKENNWLAVTILVLSGVVCALQIGKLPIATPFLQAELGVSRGTIGNLGAVFATLGIFAGIPIGTMALRLGLRYSITMGLTAIGISSLLAPWFPSLEAIYALRIIEGFGFVFVTVSAPSLVQASVQLSYRNAAMSFWGAFMPIGMTVIMISGPFFHNWQSLWVVNGLIAFAVIALVRLYVPRPATRPQALSLQQTMALLKSVITAGTPLRMALTFGCYTLMYFAMFNFLPLLLIERLGLSHHEAGIISGLATGANIFGNLGAGYFLSKGYRRVVLIPLTFLIMIIMGGSAFLFELPVMVVALACIIFAGIGGMIPASVLSSAPIITPSPMAIPITIGLLMQGSNLGQGLGPLLTGWGTELFGWSAAGVILALIGLLGLGLVLFRRLNL